MTVQIPTADIPIADAKTGRTTLEWYAALRLLSKGETVTLANLSAELAAMPFGNDAFTKVLLHFDGADAATTFTDVAYGALTHAPHVWTAAGNAQIDTAESKFGGASGLFDGAGDYVDTPDHADFALGSDDFTIDFQFNCTATSGSTERVCGHGGATGAATDQAFLIERNTSNRIQVLLSNGTAFTTISGTTQFTDAVNAGWHHCAYVRSGTSILLFIDGDLEGSGTFSGSVFNATGNFAIGTRGGGSTATPWTGWIDEFRLSVGIARWTANFTPPTLPYGPTP